LFGGHLEANETPEQALRRELMEEINGEIQELPPGSATTTSIAVLFLPCGPAGALRGAGAAEGSGFGWECAPLGCGKRR